MSTTTGALVYKQYDLQTQLLAVYRSVHPLICAVKTITEPLAQLNLKVAYSEKNKDQPVIYYPAISGSDGNKTAADIAYNTEYEQNALFKVSGAVYIVNKKITLADEPALITAIISGDVSLSTRPIASEDYQSPDHVVQRVEYKEKAFRSDASSARILGAAITHEMIDDLQASYPNNPLMLDQAMQEMIYTPLLSHIDLDIFNAAWTIAQPQTKELTSNKGDYISARNLLASIELCASEMYADTKTAATAVICSSAVLGVLRATGKLEPVEDDNGVIPNRFITPTGLLVAALDPWVNVPVDYCLLASVEPENTATGISNVGLMTCYYHPKAQDEIFKVAEVLDVESFQPYYRSSVRSCLIAADMNTTDKITNNAGSFEHLQKIKGTSPFYRKFKVVLND